MSEYGGMAEMALAHGFESEKEFIALVYGADLSTPEKIAAFKVWQKLDGSREGLLRLQKKVSP